MRGEYKVPSGPLVVVDVTTADGLVVAVTPISQVAPETAAVVDRVLGMSDNAGVEAYVEAMSQGAEATSEIRDIAVAIRRGLAGATRWEDITFDLIRPRSLSPALHVALDEVIAQEVAKGRANPNFRLWEWDTPCVVIGSFQSYCNEIDDEGRQRNGFEIIRRISGGGAMFMEPANAVTYSLVAPTSLVEALTFEQSYAFLDEWVLEALRRLGIRAKYVPLNDIASDRGKIGGAAQRRLAKGAVLHHVTSSYDIDSGKMLQILRIGRNSLSEKGTKSANKRVDPMRSQTRATRAQVMEMFMETFASRYRCVERDYTDAELAAAQELVDVKFGTAEWTRRVP
ncbi:MAG: lipoate--protein ligase family protein [Propionibacteriaceae bacterium]